MYPDQNQQPRQSDQVPGMEYLDQISTKPVSKLAFINRKVLVGGGVIAVLLVVLVITLAMSSGGGTPSSETLGARFDSLNKLLDYSNNNSINSSDIKKAVAETLIVVSSDKYQLSKAVSIPKASKETVAREAVDTTIADLDKAKSTGNLGAKYTAALRNKIDEILVSLNDLRSKASGTSRITIEKSIADFTEMRARLDVN
ncbi:hypothetical protein FACS189431_3820 [Alphaproteobacteria bacterium]|nr:hypothetical protein FACS189431_3820 [Alphaproteobacteria bacterium]